MNFQKIHSEYEQLRRDLGKLGWISQGHVWDRGRGGSGPRYQWTRQVAGKTVTVALSQEQYVAFKEASQNWKQAQSILQRMQVLTRQFIYSTYPNPPRRKPMTAKALGII